ncbi:MAG: UbiD family decarboxylase [Chloroflexi bacterium]|nr:UbiD family decarboxylase [Chloroflexota bacterium]
MSLNDMRDLRDWLQVVDNMGDLQVVLGADWNLEIGGISELNYRRKPSAALLFDQILGYPPGYRVLTGSLTNARRVGVALRLGTDISDEQLVDALSGKPLEWEEQARHFEPVEVPSAPLHENVLDGPDASLLRFPAPLWHEHDGGRYLGTGCMVITRDPDTHVVNGGAYRIQIRENGAITVNPVPGKHGWQHVEKWLARDGRAPIAVSFGHDPLLLMVAGTEVPTGVSELNYAGAMIGRPLEVVRGEITGLPIPASSEIAVEGWVHKGRALPEGPYGEWTGYYSGSEVPIPEVEVARVYHRNDPILLGSPPAKPPHDYSYMRTVMKSAMIHDSLVKAGIPEVRRVWAHESGGGRLLLVVSIKQRYCGHSRQAGFVAAQCQAAAYMNRYVIVVDEDIDPMNLDDVMWAVCTRSDPSEDIEIMRKSWGSKADPMLRDHRRPYNTRAIIDACRPFEWIGEFPRVARASPALLRRIRAKWSDLFSDPRFPLPAGAIGSIDVGDDGRGAQAMMGD